MTRRLPPPRAALACALLLACGSLLAACGSSHTDTVIATTPVNSDGTTTTGTTATTNTTPAVTTRTATVPAPGGTPATATTRTAPEPAFTEHESHAEGVGAAAALVRAHGYTPNNTGEYHSGQTLRVLVATRTGSGDGYGQQAFFFLGNRYLGTDTKEPSASVKVVSQGDTEVTLAYPLYRPSDPLCCPGAGQATVHFQLDHGRLQALGRIPPASSKTGVSRG
ncbi:MAG TPA: LppP/LprE family lipoprotein [Solirubrobacteraceae bacterium]|nr:LppP/LprE family lipoprotein [Solirubrobacteraceae bacterium]